MGFKDLKQGQPSVIEFPRFRTQTTKSYWVSNIKYKKKPKKHINFLNRSEAINITATALVKNAFNQFLSLWKQIYGLCKIHLTHTEQKKKRQENLK